MADKSQIKETIEINPGEFEEIEKDVHPFFHSLGSALQGKKVDNEYLKANLERREYGKQTDTSQNTP